MPKYLVQVTETINHAYIIEAGDPDEALDNYYNLSDDELVSLDTDGDKDWDKPWDVEEQVEGDN